MTVKTGSSWAGTFVTKDATGALSTPSVGPAGVLYVDGVANAATVTITGSNPYKWSVTLPALTAGQRVEMYITATISTIATSGIVASDQADTALVGEVKTETASILEDTGTTLDGKINTIDTVVDGIVTDMADVNDILTPLGVVDANVDAIKFKTDQLVFTVANQVDSNALSGGGSGLDAAGVRAAIGLASANLDSQLSGVAAAVWAYANRTLSSFGTLISSVWAWGSRTLTGFTTTEFNVIGPVRNDGKIDAIAGDDYYTADGRGMQWSDTAWPNLTGATVNFISGSTTIAMSVVTAGTGEQTVNLDVPKANSAAMKGEFKFIIQATLTNAHVVTLLEGEGKFK